MDWKEEIRYKNEVRRRLNRLAWLLDSSIPIPGTRLSIGIDALIGLVPFIGDLAGVLLSSTILIEAARLGAGRSVLARMALNVAVEGLAGLVPFAGDVFDAAWKANQRNLALFEAHLDNPRQAVKSSRVFVAVLVAALVAFIALTAAAGFFLVRAIWRAFS